jgi:predicted nuclease of predicted toxin-antitoxin system
MKIKLDESLPSLLAPRLAAMSHDVHTVVEEGIAGKPAPVVWQAAQSEGRFLVTQDMDFSNAQRLTPGTHHGVLLIRMHNTSWRAIVARVADLFAHEDVTQWATCFVVATESKVRVRRPATLG